MQRTADTADIAEPCLLEMFACAVRGLADIVTRGMEQEASRGLPPVLLQFFLGWLERARQRFHRLLERAVAGKLSRWRWLPPPKDDAPVFVREVLAEALVRRGGAPPLVRLPVHYAWLAKVFPEVWEAASLLQRLLARPETERLFMRAPVACSRILRGVYWALGVRAPTILTRNVLRLPSPQDQPEIWRALVAPIRTRRRIRRPKARRAEGPSAEPHPPEGAPPAGVMPAGVMPAASAPAPVVPGDAPDAPARERPD